MCARPAVGHGIDIRRAAGPADETRRCAMYVAHVPEQEGPCTEPLRRAQNASLVGVIYATDSRVKYEAFGFVTS